MSPVRIAAFALVAIVCLAPAAPAHDWPQWRGPNRDDKSTETGLLKSWPEGGPPRVWMFKECGKGYGGPAIAGGVLFIIGTRDEQEVLLAINATSGEEIWHAAIGEIYSNDWGDGARSTPTVDGEMVYALGGKGDLVCVKAASGDVVWTKSMIDLDGEIPNWGYSESPTVYKDLVICTPGGEQGALAAFNKSSGELVWRATDVKPGAHYSSIVLTKHAGHDEAVQLLHDQVVGFDPATGKIHWSEPWPKPIAAIPTPIVSNGGEYVFASSGYGVGSKLIHVGADHQIDVVYENKVMKNKLGGAVLIDGYLYGHSEGAGWVCQEFKTGEQAWRDRDVMEMGSVTFADGLLYCVGEESGDVALVEPSPEEWKERSRFKLEPQTEIRSDRGRIWTHPVVCNGMLYLRDQDLVYCYDVRDKSVAKVSGR
jgi:outer membrane protein assembly factor BamB